jgi:hypothetical protein
MLTLGAASPHHADPRFDLISLTLTGAGGASPHHAASWFDLIADLNWLLASLAVIVVVAGIMLFDFSLKRRLLREISRNDRRQPPWLAESLLCIFARAKDIDALMGDFEELFARDRASGMSEHRAVARYWARVLRSLWPQIWQWTKRIGWAGLIAVVLRKSGG